MPRVYDVCLAKCPFFITSGKKNIVCEGITDDCTTDILFISERKRNTYRRTFCDSRYQSCKVYELLLKKYEE